MRARAEVIAESCDGRVAYPLLRSDPPLLLRPTHSGLTLQAGAAGPIGGDQLELVIRVRSGARLDISTTAAMVVLPGPEPSRLDVSIVVEAGATLNFLHSHHRSHGDRTPSGSIGLLNTLRPQNLRTGREIWSLDFSNRRLE